MSHTKPAPRKVRETIATDVPGIKQILDATKLFPSAMLDPMIGPFLNKELPKDTPQVWLTITDAHGRPIGAAFAVYEVLTNMTWNLVFIAVDPQLHGTGVGTTLLTAMEDTLMVYADARMLMIDTASTKTFLKTRTFYEKRGYKQVAQIPDFYDRGEHKVVYQKRFGLRAHIGTWMRNAVEIGMTGLASAGDSAIEHALM